MTEGEEQAVVTAKKYYDDFDDVARVKKLLEEVLELGIALGEGDPKHIRDEVGDCMFILCHIWSRHDENNVGLIPPMIDAVDKVERRMNR